MKTPEELIARANRAVGKGIFYWLGAGIDDPDADLPTSMTRLSAIKGKLTAAQQAELLAAGFDESRYGGELPTCDCSAYVCWALGIHKTSTKPGYRTEKGDAGSVYTDSVWQDAQSTQSLFVRLPEAEVGCIVVFPSPGKRNGERIPGHIAIVTGVAGGQAARVLHCSAKNSHGLDAIQETAADVFLAPMARPSLYAWSREIIRP